MVKKMTAEEQVRAFRNTMKKSRHMPCPSRNPKYEIVHKVETLLLDLECTFPDGGRILATPFIGGGWPYHLAHYRDCSDSNIYMFYQFDNHPGKCLYLRGSVKKSKDSEACVFTALISSQKRIDIMNNINFEEYRENYYAYDIVNKVMGRLDNAKPLPGFKKGGVNVSYDADALEEMIYKGLPKELTTQKKSRIEEVN